MARRPSSPRPVQCYLCRHRFEVGQMAQSTSCPHCHKAVIVEDLILKKNRPKLLLVSKVQTCGKIVVPKGARIGADLIEGHGGLEVEGQLEAKRVVSSHVVIGRTAEWRGDLRAIRVSIEEGARIKRSFFDVPHDELLLSTLHEPPPATEPDG